jgi:hypothetical protein
MGARRASLPAWQRLDACLQALQITGPSKAQVWEKIRRLPRILPVA